MLLADSLERWEAKKSACQSVPIISMRSLAVPGNQRSTAMQTLEVSYEVVNMAGTRHRFCSL